jgi:hypothetical protein
VAIGYKIDLVSALIRRTLVGIMRDAAEYRTHADECMRLAHQLERKEHRETLIQMAQTWLRLAEKRERSVDSKTVLGK